MTQGQAFIYGQLVKLARRAWLNARKREIIQADIESIMRWASIAIEE
jgi:hypothetical protein